MSTSLVPVSNLIEYSGRPWSDVKFIEVDASDSSSSSGSDAKRFNSIPKEAAGSLGGASHSTQLLSRADYLIYGRYPKLEPKILLECDKCGMVLLPCVFRAHYENPEHVSALPKTAATSSATNTRASAGSRSRRASKQTATQAPVGAAPLPPPPASSSNSHSYILPSTQAATAVAAAMTPTTPMAAPSTASAASPAAPTQLSMVSSTSTAGRSKKKSKRSRREDKEISDKDMTAHKAGAGALLPPPTPELEPAPQIKRSKFDTQASPTPETVNETTSIPTINLMNTEPEAKTTTKATTATVSTTITTSSMSIKHEMAQFQRDIPSSSYTVTTAVSTQPPLQLQELKHEDSEQMEMQDMPMSPVAVVNIVPVKQYLQQYLQLPTQPIVVTIPCSNSSTFMYSSYPKPLTVSTRALRRCGSTYLLQGRRLDHQRADIQQALSRARRAFTNSTSTTASSSIGAQNHLPT